ncbi:hypothetical protein IW261DRAFT_1513067 [Armillaria novae-zelandiae]|uniref:Uncharacterized protein n=1 Tax=Armillaria novae-zelandiae TaxID=153914 RepID=A0AA39NSL5_9AGAR|nr:hypothetical protein IW261DRAFT_1513067 [Armillaria novae-zelandiae]
MAALIQVTPHSTTRERMDSVSQPFARLPSSSLSELRPRMNGISGPFRLLPTAPISALFASRTSDSCPSPPYPSSRSRGSDALAIDIESLKKLVEDHDHLPRTRKLLKAMDKVVDCLDRRQLPSIGPEVTLHQMLKENIRSIRALKWYKRPFSKKTARREMVDKILCTIWDYAVNTLY